MENRVRNASSQIHQGLPRLDWVHKEKTFLNVRRPLPTGLEGLGAISSMQKVLQWLEVHVPTDPGALAKEDEDSKNKTDKEQFHELFEEDITCPVPSEIWEDSSPSQDVSEGDSDQDLLQWEEDENKAVTAETISKLQSIYSSLPDSMNTKDEPATSLSQASHQRRKASATTPTGAGHAPSIPSWEVPSVPGAGLLPSQPPGDRSPFLTATHTPVQQQRPSLFRRALRAVCRVFLGIQRPRQQEQQGPAPSARQEPGDDCSKPQQRPLRE